MVSWNKKQWELLKKSAELKKLPHAFLFYGQKNSGKEKFAVDFAKLIIGKIAPPDFVSLDSQKGEIHIGQIRDLIKKLSFKPYLADFKIAVINKAHSMTLEAQNCFLKFLEEPKDKTLLILITEYPLSLLPTILSRVQKIRFYPENRAEIEDPKELILVVRSGLSDRFQYVKDLSGENLEEILDNWLFYFRKIFLGRFVQKKFIAPDPFGKYSLSDLKEIMKQIQSTKFLLSTTNVNSRLALELLLMRI